MAQEKQGGFSTTTPPDSLKTPAYIDQSSGHMEDARSRSGLKHIFKNKVLGVPDDVPATVHTLDYVRGNTNDTGTIILDYIKSLFPFIQWLPRYNLTWLTGDLIA